MTAMTTNNFAPKLLYLSANQKVVIAAGCLTAPENLVTNGYIDAVTLLPWWVLLTFYYGMYERWQLLNFLQTI